MSASAAAIPADVTSIQFLPAAPPKSPIGASYVEQLLQKHVRSYSPKINPGHSMDSYRNTTEESSVTQGKVNLPETNEMAREDTNSPNATGAKSPFVPLQVCFCYEYSCTTAFMFLGALYCTWLGQ